MVEVQNSGNGPVLTLGGRDGRLCRLDTEKEEAMVSEGRYDFRYDSIQMNGITYRSNINSVAYPHTSQAHIGVPEEFMNLIVKNLDAQVMFSWKQKHVMDTSSSFYSWTKLLTTYDHRCCSDTQAMDNPLYSFG